MDLVPLLQALIRIDSTSSRPNAPVLDLLEGEVRAAGF
jgi:acetylornithine deacetylase/succinyl-diaminopimelate desuccinylase-like protein